MSIVEHNVRYYGENIEKEAHRLAVEAAALHAVAAVEVGEIAHPGLGAPVIRFEVHVFLRRVGTSSVVQLRDAPSAWHKDAHWYKSDVDDAWQRVHSGSQADEWGALIRAQEEDPTAAWESASYGVGQLMGWHWELLGYRNVQRMVAGALGGGVSKQIRQWGTYIERDQEGAMLVAMRNKDWPEFVRMYNGPGQVDYYVDALEKRYDEAKLVLSMPLMPDEEISLDTWGERQEALIALGYDPGPVDGKFGPSTERAVKAFQADAGLTPDGIWGAKTEKAVTEALAQLG